MRPLGAALILAEGQTDVTKPICAFRNYANPYNNNNNNNNNNNVVTIACNTVLVFHD